MKRRQLLLVLFAFGLLTQCKKDKPATTPPTLVAKWSLLSDYTANHLAQMNAYTGVPGDYFDFRVDGKCYVKEGSHYDTLLYALKNDTTITIAPFAYNNAAYFSGQGSPLTVHSATLTSVGPYPPVGIGEIDYRQVKLAK
ncbi:MAG: hypothetical protein ACXVIY_01840 [Mucilaginibacter sp.]